MNKKSRLKKKEIIRTPASEHFSGCFGAGVWNFGVRPQRGVEDDMRVE